MLLEAAQKKATEKLDLEMKDLKQTNEEQGSKIEQMCKQELELRKKQRKAIEKEKNLELELEQKLDKERKNIFNQAKQDVADETCLKMAEKDRVCR